MSPFRQCQKTGVSKVGSMGAVTAFQAGVAIYCALTVDDGDTVISVGLDSQEALFAL